MDVFDSIRLEWHDSSCIKSNRLTGSRFAREKNTARRLFTPGRVTNVDDSTRIARFVFRKVELTHQKSTCERLRKKYSMKAIFTKEGNKC